MPAPGADYGQGFEPLHPLSVVYATWEDSPAQINGRLHWAERAKKQGTPGNLWIADMRAKGHIWAALSRYETPALTPAGEGLRALARAKEARLLVIDTLGVAFGASEIDRSQVGAFFADWASWADENDCVVLLIAHPPKTAGTNYSGSTGMLGGVRAMWCIEKVQQKGEEGDSQTSAYRLVNAKQNYTDDKSSIWLDNQFGLWVETEAAAYR